MIALRGSLIATLLIVLLFIFSPSALSQQPRLNAFLSLSYQKALDTQAEEYQNFYYSGIVVRYFTKDSTNYWGPRISISLPLSRGENVYLPISLALLYQRNMEKGNVSVFLGYNGDFKANGLILGAGYGILVGKNRNEILTTISYSTQRLLGIEIGYSGFLTPLLPK